MNQIRKYMSEIGKKGGQAGRGPAKARTTEQARKAALARWAKEKKKEEEPKLP